MRKRLCSAALALVMAVALALAIPAGAVDYAGGSGTRNDPYLIGTAEQLKDFRDQVNSGNTGLCARLTANIDLAGQTWEPIGLSSAGYTGTFDGSGYAIRNLYITDISTGTSAGGWTLWGCGLFGIVGKGGVVRGVNVDGTIAMKGENRTDIDLGCVAGGNLGTIEECFATVSFQDFDLTITSPSSTSTTTIGGLVGVNQGIIRNCYVVGTMNLAIQTKRVSVGGLAGHLSGSGATLEHCYAAVPIQVSTTAQKNVGALVGKLNSKGICKNLYANGDLASRLQGESSPYTISGAALLSTRQMQRADFAQTLGSAFAADTQKVNQGYPILLAMAYDEESGWSEWFEDEAMGDNVNQEIFDSLIPPELQNRDLTRDITRAEFCAVAVRLYEQMGGRQLDATVLDAPFADTSADAVKKAYALGITNGVSATSFAPYTNISREQLATMLTRVYKALNLPGWTLDTDDRYQLDYSGTKRFEDDKDISAYAKPSVYFMVKNEVIKGTSATTFSPRNVTPAQEAIGYANASREQALIMAVRMFQKL